MKKKKIVRQGKMSSKILIVDDKMVSGRTLCNLIEAIGYEADHVLSGEDAIEEVRKEQHSLVFMDYRMPKMDGLEATRRIREFNKTIPIYLFSSDNIEEEQLKEVGATGYLPKDAGPSEINSILGKLK